VLYGVVTTALKKNVYVENITLSRYYGTTNTLFYQFWIYIAYMRELHLNVYSKLFKIDKRRLYTDIKLFFDKIP